VTTGAIGRAKLQSNHHHQQTNAQLSTGPMSFLSPNQQCQRTEGSSMFWNTDTYREGLNDLIQALTGRSTNWPLTHWPDLNMADLMSPATAFRLLFRLFFPASIRVRPGTHTSPKNRRGLSVLTVILQVKLG